MPNLASILSDTAARSPASPALRIGDSMMSYAALDGLSARAAGLLASRGIGSGDRVALLLPDIPPMAALYYGVLRLGAVAVPMNPLLGAREITYQLADSGAPLLFAFGYEDIIAHADDGAAEAGTNVIPVNTGSFRELLAAAEPRPGVVDRADNDAAVILYTSGATGTPKGATLSHANLRSAADAASGLLSVQDSDVLFGGLPLFHGFGQALVMNAAVLAGASVSLLPRFEPGTALQMIERDGVTIFAGIPAMYAAMLEHPALGETDTSSVRSGISGTAPLPRESLEGFERAFGVQVLEAYGLAEALVSFNAPVPERRPGSVGQPVPGMEVRIVDGAANDVREGEAGELVTRGEGLMLGYWNDPQTTAGALTDGWLHTGDLARFDEQGNIYVVGRVEV
ncbi:AMP-binding protein [Arthrobacter sp. zg-Y238]|uniref:AMP-binding protein n=1 Tax=Arthrobacter sp. zg-Y238 TaxID=2964614 RepID=UPI00210282D3|nr:AMP-binding protein [Arthrobacter sp. zg-Y238]